MLEIEIAFLKGKLSELDAQRDALLRSISVLEGASNSSGSTKGSPAIKDKETKPESKPPRSTGIRDAVRSILAAGDELQVEQIEERLKEFAGLKESTSHRALDTCLYKLQKRKEIRIRKNGVNKFVRKIAPNDLAATKPL